MHVSPFRINFAEGRIHCFFRQMYDTTSKTRNAIRSSSCPINRFAVIIDVYKRQPGNHMVAVFSDGSVEDYGDPQAFSELVPKFLTMLEACRRPQTMVPCTVETVRPHLAVCQGLFEQAETRPFPADRVFAGGEPEGVYVHGLSGWICLLYTSRCV